MAVLAEDLVIVLRAAGDPARVRGAQAYMKTRDPFFGVGAVPLRAALKPLYIAHRPGTQAEYLSQVAALWAIPEREGKYAAVEWARQFSPFITLDALPLYERMVRKGQWWDTVDAIAAHLVGRLLATQRDAMKPRMEAWNRDPDLWIRRTSLLAHLKHKASTDHAQLFAHCLRLAGEKEFFIRKAIGWVLRTVAEQDPERVAAWIRPRLHRMSGLTRREATRKLPEGLRVALEAEAVAR